VSHRPPGHSDAEQFFQDSEYWTAWSQVPDDTPDIDYAMATIRSGHRTVLDVPCGRGRLLKTIRARAPRCALFAADVNHQMIRQVKEAVPEARPVVASVYSLPFRDLAFDVVVCHESFMHFEEPVRALSELLRVTRQSVCFSVTTRRQLNTLLRQMGLLGPSGVPHWTYDLEDLVGLLPSAEFEWKFVGAFLVGRKALRLSHGAFARWHRRIGRRLPQWLLRRFGQKLFVYGERREGQPST
jgi:SAM-dependent methyltransferase